MGMDHDAVVAIYGVTGRSPASQARRYVREGDAVVVMPTDEAALATGARDLLVYPAFRFFRNGFVVANGNQINAVLTDLEHDLAAALPEPDQYLTPRITGMVAGASATLHIARLPAQAGASGNNTWDVPLVSGKGKFISTYDGDEANPTAYSGVPRDVGINFGSAVAAARGVYDLLAPEYRIAVVAVYHRAGEAPEVAIKNRF